MCPLVYPSVADDLAYRSKFKYERLTQFMLSEAEDIWPKQVSDTPSEKTQIFSLPNTNNEDLKSTLGDNELTLKDKTFHLGLIRSGKQE